MLKKIIAISILTIMIWVSSLASFAIDPIMDIISKSGFESTEQFIVTITRPEGDEFTFKKSYVISGVTDIQNVVVKIYIDKDEDGKYEPFKNTDGYSSWKVGSSGVFMKEVSLPNIGSNRIMVTACREADLANPKLNQNLQANSFTVTLLNSTIKDAFKNGPFNFKGIMSKTRIGI